MQVFKGKLFIQSNSGLWSLRNVSVDVESGFLSYVVDDVGSKRLSSMFYIRKANFQPLEEKDMKQHYCFALCGDVESSNEASDDLHIGINGDDAVSLVCAAQSLSEYANWRSTITSCINFDGIGSDSENISNTGGSSNPISRSGSSNSMISMVSESEKMESSIIKKKLAKVQSSIGSTSPTNANMSLSALQLKISRQEEDIARLERELEEAADLLIEEIETVRKDEAEKASIVIRELQSKVQKLEIENKEWSSKHASNVSRNSPEPVLNSTTEIKELRGKLLEKDVMLESVTKQLQNCESLNRELEESLRKVDGSKDRVDWDKNRKLVEDYQIQVRKLRADNRHALQHIMKYEKVVADLKDAEAKSNIRIAELTSRVNSQHSETFSTSTTIVVSELKTKVDQQQLLITKYEHELEEAAEMLVREMQEYKRKEAEKINKLTGDFQNQLQALQLEHSELLAKHTLEDRLIKKFKVSESQNLKIIADLKAKLTQFVKNSDGEKVGNASGEAAGSETTEIHVQELQQEVVELRRQLKQTVSVETESRVQDLQQEVVELRRQLKQTVSVETESRVQDLQQEVVELRRQLKQTVSVETESRVQDLQQEVVELRRQLKQTVSVETESRILELLTKCNEANHQLLLKDTELDKISAELKEYQARMSDDLSRSDEHERNLSELSDLKVIYNNVCTERVEQAALLQRLQRELEQKCSLIDELTGKLESSSVDKEKIESVVSEKETLFLENRRLSKEVLQLETTINALRLSESAYLAKNTELQNVIDSQSEDIGTALHNIGVFEKLKVKLFDLQEQYSLKEQECATLSSTHTSLNERIVSLQSIISDQNSCMDDSQKSLVTLNERLIDLQQRISEQELLYNESSAIWQAEKSDLLAQLEAQKIMLASYEGLADAAEQNSQQFDSLRLKYEDQQQIIANQANVIAEMDSRNAELNNRISEQLQFAELQVEHIGKLQEDLAKMRVNLKHIVDSVGRSDKVDIGSVALQRTVELLRRELECEKQKNFMLESAAEVSRHNVQDMERQTKYLLNNVRDMSSRVPLAEEHQKLIVEASNMRLRIAELEEQILSCQDEKIATKKASEVENDLRIKKDGGIRSEIGTYTDKISALEAQVKSLESSAQEKEAIVTEAKAEISEAMSSYVKVREQAAELEEIMLSLREQLVEKERELAKLKEDTVPSTPDSQPSQTEVAPKSIDLAAAQQDLELREKKLAELELEMEKKLAEREAEMEKKLAEREAEMEKKLAEREAEMEKKMSNLNNTTSDTAYSNSSLNYFNTKKSEVMLGSSFSSQDDSFGLEKAEWRRVIDDKRLFIEKLNREKEELVKENIKLRRSLHPSAEVAYSDARLAINKSTISENRAEELLDENRKLREALDENGFLFEGKSNLEGKVESFLAVDTRKPRLPMHLARGTGSGAVITPTRKAPTVVLSG